MMKLKGALAAAVLFGGGVALAQQPQPEPLPMGSGAEARTSQSQHHNLNETELIGTVIRADDETLYVRNEQGESVQLKVDDQTRFEGETVQNLEDLQAGQEVRASYAVEGEENVASSIGLKRDKKDKAMGGAGDEGIDSGMREKDTSPPPPVTPEPGTGGAGDLTAPDAGSYDPMPEGNLDPNTGGSGIDHTGSMDDPVHEGMNEPVDRQQ